MEAQSLPPVLQRLLRVPDQVEKCSRCGDTAVSHQGNAQQSHRVGATPKIPELWSHQWGATGTGLQLGEVLHGMCLEKLQEWGLGEAGDSTLA